MNINGSIDINSDNAGVRLENIAGAVRLDLRASDVVRAVNLKSTLDVKGRGGDIELENVEGQVNINGAYNGISQLRNIAKRNRASLDEVREYYKEQNLFPQLAMEILERKVRAFLRSNAVVEQPNV